MSKNILDSLLLPVLDLHTEEEMEDFVIELSDQEVMI